MSWHGALSKRQSRGFFRSYIKPATDFETNPSLSGIQKNKRIPIEQLPYGGRGNAGPPREVDAAPMVDSTTTNSRTRRREALVQSARAPARSKHGHSVEVMLRMYAAWIEGATEADIQAIRNAMEARPKVSLLPFAQASPRDSACQIVLRPLASPDSASSSASSPEGKKVRAEKAQKKWRRGWDSNPEE